MPRDDLTPEDRARLTMLLAIAPRLSEMEKSDSRVQWLWAGVGRLLKWLFAVAAGLVAFKLLLGDLVTKLFK